MNCELGKGGSVVRKLGGVISRRAEGQAGVTFEYASGPLFVPKLLQWKDNVPVLSFREGGKLTLRQDFIAWIPDQVGDDMTGALSLGMLRERRA